MPRAHSNWFSLPSSWRPLVAGQGGGALEFLVVKIGPAGRGDSGGLMLI